MFIEQFHLIMYINTMGSLNTRVNEIMDKIYNSNGPSNATELEEQFDAHLGETEFSWEERTKVQTIAFSVAGKKIWITIDKKVIRSEILRIIDSCLPIVKRYS